MTLPHCVAICYIGEENLLDVMVALGAANQKLINTDLKQEEYDKNKKLKYILYNWNVCIFFWQTGVYTNTVVLQHHSVVMTKADKIYKVKCTYDMSSKNITFGMMPIRYAKFLFILCSTFTAAKSWNCHCLKLKFPICLTVEEKPQKNPLNLVDQGSNPGMLYELSHILTGQISLYSTELKYTKNYWSTDKVF